MEFLLTDAYMRRSVSINESKIAHAQRVFAVLRIGYWDSSIIHRSPTHVPSQHGIEGMNVILNYGLAENICFHVLHSLQLKASSHQEDTILLV